MTNTLQHDDTTAVTAPPDETQLYMRLTTDHLHVLLAVDLATFEIIDGVGVTIAPIRTALALASSAAKDRVLIRFAGLEELHWLAGLLEHEPELVEVLVGGELRALIDEATR